MQRRPVLFRIKDFQKYELFLHLFFEQLGVFQPYLFYLVLIFDKELCFCVDLEYFLYCWHQNHLVPKFEPNHLQVLQSLGGSENISQGNLHLRVFSRRSRTLSCEDDILLLQLRSCRALKPGKNWQNRLKILPSDDSTVVGVAVPTLVEEKDHGSHLAVANNNQNRGIGARSQTQKQVGNKDLGSNLPWNHPVYEFMLLPTTPETLVKKCHFQF